MTPVDLSNLTIVDGKSNSILVGTKYYQEPTSYNFPTPLEAVRHLADNETHENHIRNAFEERLKSQPTIKEWKANREKLSTTPHFSKYRHNEHYEKYHDAARAFSSGNASTEQLSMVNGLAQEIRASKVIVPAGQVLFHGCANIDLTSSSTYPTFISTSLIPAVAFYHAKKRGIKTGQHPIIYILTASESLQAIWGNGGGLDEWELLLDCGLSCTFICRHPGKHFDVIEAAIGR